MPPGKLAAQAGHAYLEAFLAALAADPERAAAYASDPPGTKVCLAAPSEAALLAVARRAEAAGLPVVLITDHGHVLPPHFAGGPVRTAVGIGPARRSEVRHVTGTLALVR